MSKIVNTTDDAVREAAKSCPEAKKVLDKLFPGVLVPSFKPGMRVRYKCDHDGNAQGFIVASEYVAAKFDHGINSDGSVAIIRVSDGQLYSPGPDFLETF